MDIPNLSKLPTSVGKREPKLQADTSRFLEQITALVSQLNVDSTAWLALRDAAKANLEDVVREAASGTNPHMLLGSVQFQQRVLELTIRLDILDELIHMLPLQNYAAHAEVERRERSRLG